MNSEIEYIKTIKTCIKKTYSPNIFIKREFTKTCKKPYSKKISIYGSLPLNKSKECEKINPQ
jgi:putative heme iron utilization protein